MAGYIGSKAVSVNTTSATISDDLAVGDDATITGDLDVDGTTNLDVVDIDGAVNMAQTALVTGVLTTTAATVFNGGFASNNVSTIIAADGAGDNAYALQIKNQESTDDRSYGILIQAGSTAVDSPLNIATHDGGTSLFTMVGSGQAQFVDGTAALPAISNLADLNTGILFPAADAIGFSTGGTERMRVTTDNLLLSQTAPSQDFGDGRVFISMKGRESADYSGVQMANYGTTGNDQNLGILAFWDGTTSENARISAIRESANTDAGLAFYTRPTGGSLTQRLRINHDGNLLFGDNLNTSAATNDVAGVTVGKVGNIQASVDGNPCLFVNRKGGDGTIVSIRQAGGEEGTISVSGSTVSYNAFSGSHWSRLTDNSQPTILKGTLIETIDEMCDWYQAQFTIPATTKVNEDGTVEDVAAYTVKEPIALPNEASVGDTISHISNDVTYSATIVKENDNKHTECKISDTADSLRVYGVFAAWDGDDDTVNDMYVTAVGTHVVRIHGGQTVSAGDLLVSNGDGTAKVQDDDIIRSKTLGKVLTNIKQETYADDSYTVPCALYCG